MTDPQVPARFDPRICTLGEGPLWHPARQQFFWFDILNRQLLSRTDAGPDTWTFDQIVSAAGWIDDTRLLIASDSRLFTFDLSTGAEDTVVPLEADNPGTRSNDGRADPMGGFWIGTMGKSAEEGAGAIYRFHKGEVRRLFGDITVPNAICFAPSGGRAYFGDSHKQQVFSVALDDQGWPKEAPEVFLNLGNVVPDGAVCDASGNLWNAQWGASRVAAYAPDGRFLQAFDLPARHTSCPAFGGADLTDLYVTSALEHLPQDGISPNDGQTFRIPGAGHGTPEPQVIL